MKMHSELIAALTAVQTLAAPPVLPDVITFSKTMAENPINIATTPPTDPNATEHAASDLARIVQGGQTSFEEQTRAQLARVISAAPHSSQPSAGHRPGPARPNAVVKHPGASSSGGGPAPQ